MQKKLGRWAGLLGLALAGVGAAWWGVKQTEKGVTRRYFNLDGETTDEGGLSGLAFEPANATPQTPAMIVAHGFSASKEIMQSIGAEMARQGVRALLFDFPGHGASPVPFTLPQTMDFSEVVNRNVRQVERIYNHLRSQFPDAPMGVLGHSMGSAAIANFAKAHPELKATIPMSPVGGTDFSSTNPANLLLLVGQRDIPFCITSAREMFQQAAGGATKVGDTVGQAANGSARRLAILKGLDHISIVFAPATMREINGWLRESFGLSGTPQVQPTQRLAWMGFGLAASFAAFFPFSRLLTGLLSKPVARRVKANWTDHAGAFAWLIASQFASTLILNKVKLPRLVRLQLGDYIAAFFGLSGLLSWVGLAALGRGRLQLGRMSSASAGDTLAKLVNWVAVPLGLWVFVYATVGRFSQRTWTNFSLSPTRRRAMTAIWLTLLPYFLADELVCRRLGGWQGYVLSVLGKVGVMAALVLAVRLKPELNFIMLLLPTMAPTFVLFGLCAAWQYAGGHDFATSGVFQSLVFAWIISTLFPVI